MILYHRCRLLCSHNAYNTQPKLSAARTMDLHGQGAVLMSTGVCCAASAAAIMYTAPSLDILLLGRVTYGLGIGFGMHAAPAYIAEVCPAKVRRRCH